MVLVGGEHGVLKSAIADASNSGHAKRVAGCWPNASRLDELRNTHAGRDGHQDRDCSKRTKIGQQEEQAGLDTPPSWSTVSTRLLDQPQHKREKRTMMSQDHIVPTGDKTYPQ